ncbi:MAG TPA: 50S ribosomal protein L19 [Patescibacteria group bacterium]|nr:50S ribosomal protein L19 [Patescibacteria group bacterium]
MISQIDFRPGDIVRVHQKILEGEKTRIQVFEGVVLKIKGRSGNKMFTVRKVVGDVAIERIFPIDSPVIEKVESKGKIKQKVTHSKLYFLRKQI